MDFLCAALYLILLGIAAHFIGNALPRKWFDAERFPYRSYRFENDGRLYRKIGVQHWKDRVPDMSRICTDMRPKTIGVHTNAEDVATLIGETCIAECVHWVLILLSSVVLLISPNITGVLLLLADILLFNLPFVIIQRYNRPKLMRLLDKMQSKKDGGNANEAAHSIK